MKILKSIRRNPRYLAETLTDPALIGLGLNRTYYEYKQGGDYNRAGTDIIEEDWDNLILLDACRYDVYAGMTPFSGPVEVRESRGSSSQQFVRGNFTDRTLHDTVVVSGNQWYLDLRDEVNCEFHAYYDVDRDIADGFVPSAEAVTETVLSKKDMFPNKRLLIHYMQPHHPFIETDVDGIGLERSSLRHTVRASSADETAVRSAYRDNLQYVLRHVQRLVESLQGKTVISADHGELLGERLSPVPIRWFGHPPGIYVNELVSVPWHVISEGPRRTIESSPPRRQATEIDETQIEQNLRDLGYK